MPRRVRNWLARPGSPRPAGRRRARASGCLLWVLILIGLLVILSLFFGSFQKGTRAKGMPSTFPVRVSVQPRAYPAVSPPSTPASGAPAAAPATG